MSGSPGRIWPFWKKNIFVSATQAEQSLLLQ